MVQRLANSYIVTTLYKIIDTNNTGLYRNDSLIILNYNKQNADKTRKEIIKIFKNKI